MRNNGPAIRGGRAFVEESLRGPSHDFCIPSLRRGGCLTSASVSLSWFSGEKIFPATGNSLMMMVRTINGFFGGREAMEALFHWCPIRTRYQRLERIIQTREGSSRELRDLLIGLCFSTLLMKCFRQSPDSPLLFLKCISYRRASGNAIAGKGTNSEARMAE